MQQDKFSNFIKEISSIVHSNPKFKYTRFRSTFVLEDLENLQDPDQGLKNCLQHCIDRTREESKKQSMEVDRIGISISSNLLDYDIYVPMRKIIENTTDAVLNLFLKVSQSKGRQGSLPRRTVYFNNYRNKKCRFTKTKKNNRIRQTWT